MPITFYIPGPLRAHAGKRGQVEVSASARNVGEALAELWQACPALRDRLLNEQGEVRQHINIFVGQENIRCTGGLASSVGDGQEISILPAVSGG